MAAASRDLGLGLSLWNAQRSQVINNSLWSNEQVMSQNHQVTDQFVSTVPRYNAGNEKVQACRRKVSQDLDQCVLSFRIKWIIKWEMNLLRSPKPIYIQSCQPRITVLFFSEYLWASGPANQSNY